MAVRLEFLTQDSEEVALATRYWSMDDEGTYLERVADMVPFRDIQQSGQIAKRVREFCIAFDENQRCCLCGNPLAVNGCWRRRRIEPVAEISLTQSDSS